MKKNLLFLSIALVALLLVSACGKAPAETETGAEGGDQSLAKVKQAGKIVVGADIPYEPMEYFDADGNPTGIDVDIVKAVAARMGVEAEFKDYGWDELFVAVKVGEIDLAVSSITITIDRSKEMLFSTPYFDAGQTAIVRADSDYAAVEDLAGKKLGAQTDTTGLDEAVRLSGENAVIYDSVEDVDGVGIVSDLKNGEIDAIIFDYITAADIVKKNPELKLLGEPFTQEYYGMATQLGNDALMDEINKQLRDMKSSGELKQIQDKYLK